MFDRLSERARRVLFFAHNESSQLGSISIDTEHLLLGLIRESKGLTNRLFADAGVALDDIRDEVLRRVPARSKTSTSAEISFSAAATRVLQHGAQEADRLLHDYVGTEHVLLGLLCEHGSVAADVLTSRGLRLDRVRERIVEILSDGERPERPGPPGIPANTFKWPWLRFVPSRTVHILYSELKPPQQPVTNYSGPGLQAYGYTLTEAIVHAWRGNRWHIDIADGLDDGTRYDFYIEFAQKRTGRGLQPDVARCYRTALRTFCQMRNATARCLGCEKHRARRTDAALLRRAGAGQRRRDGQVQSGDGTTARRASVSTRGLRGALGAVLLSRDVVRGVSRRAGDRRDGFARTLEMKREFLVEVLLGARTSKHRTQSDWKGVNPPGHSHGPTPLSNESRG
jgi:hypothetical protein